MTVKIALTPSVRATESKSPEYGKLWEDGKLSVTIVVGKQLKGAG